MALAMTNQARLTAAMGTALAVAILYGLGVTSLHFQNRPSDSNRSSADRSGNESERVAASPEQERGGHSAVGSDSIEYFRGPLAAALVEARASETQKTLILQRLDPGKFRAVIILPGHCDGPSDFIEEIERSFDGLGIQAVFIRLGITGTNDLDQDAETSARSPARLINIDLLSEKPALKDLRERYREVQNARILGILYDEDGYYLDGTIVDASATCKNSSLTRELSLVAEALIRMRRAADRYRRLVRVDGPPGTLVSAISPSTGAFKEIDWDDQVLKAKLVAVTNLRTSSISEIADKLTVVNFWGTWCLSCRTELPVLAEIARRFPSVKFIGASFERGKSLEAAAHSVKEMVEASGVSYEQYLDIERKLHASFFPGPGSYPSFVVVDPEAKKIVILDQEAGGLAVLEQILEKKFKPVEQKIQRAGCEAPILGLTADLTESLGGSIRSLCRRLEGELLLDEADAKRMLDLIVSKFILVTGESESFQRTFGADNALSLTTSRATPAGSIFLFLDPSCSVCDEVNRLIELCADSREVVVIPIPGTTIKDSVGYEAAALLEMTRILEENKLLDSYRRLFGETLAIAPYNKNGWDSLKKSIIEEVELAGISRELLVEALNSARINISRREGGAVKLKLHPPFAYYRGRIVHSVRDKELELSPFRDVETLCGLLTLIDAAPEDENASG